MLQGYSNPSSFSPSSFSSSPCLARSKTTMGRQWVQQRANTPLLRLRMRESQRTEGSRRGGKEDRGRGGTADGEGESGENGGTAGQKDEKNDWASELDRRGTFGFIAPLIPDTFGRHTGHVRYTRAGPTYSKTCFLSSNPLVCYFSVKKGIKS